MAVSHDFPSDIEALIQSHMSSGQYQSHEDLFRVALEHLASQQDEVLAIQRSIDLLDGGDEGVALDDAFANLRAKHGISIDA